MGGGRKKVGTVSRYLFLVILYSIKNPIKIFLKFPKISK